MTHASVKPIKLTKSCGFYIFIFLPPNALFSDIQRQVDIMFDPNNYVVCLDKGGICPAPPVERFESFCTTSDRRPIWNLPDPIVYRFFLHPTRCKRVDQ
jgi:hypothetical protein